MDRPSRLPIAPRGRIRLKNRLDGAHVEALAAEVALRGVDLGGWNASRLGHRDRIVRADLDAHAAAVAVGADMESRNRRWTFVMTAMLEGPPVSHR